MDEQKPQPARQVIHEVVGMSIPKVYANGFMVGISLSDLNITTLINGQPSQQILMSLTSAKALMVGLKGALDEFESRTGIEIPDVNKLHDLLSSQKK